MNTSPEVRSRAGTVWFPASPAGRQLQGNNFFSGELVAKHLESCARWHPQRPVLRRSSTGRSDSRACGARRAGRGAHHGTANPSAQGRRRQGNRGGFRDTCARSARRAARRFRPSLATRRVQLVQLAAYHKIPAIYPLRQYAEIGGSVTYGTSLTNAYRQVGVYTGRILKGAKPAESPVVQSTSSNWLSMPRQPGRLASPCRHRCSPAPTR